ncbi:MAG: hypothetical protein PHW10_06355 [Candidatus Peribacteraceae bacterium]|nr:hypothetical protein [Candidatus Peribacteraceae bacterium]
MLRTLHTLSAFFFYLLGATFFLAVVFLKQPASAAWSAWWMQVADLPLALTALLYAGISLYESLRPSGRHSPVLLWSIGVPFIAFFTLLLVLNFWPA